LAVLLTMNFLDLAAPAVACQVIDGAHRRAVLVDYLNSRFYLHWLSSPEAKILIDSTAMMGFIIRGYFDTALLYRIDGLLPGLLRLFV
jgi:hypothetical protein